MDESKGLAPPTPPDTSSGGLVASGCDDTAPGIEPVAAQAELTAVQSVCLPPWVTAEKPRRYKTHEQEPNRLVVHLIRAEGLGEMRSTSRIAKVTVGSMKYQAEPTGEQQPCWDVAFSFPVTDLVTPRFQMSLMLDIAVFDKKRFSKVRVGECRIQLGQLVPYVEVVAWFNLVHSLKDKSLRPAGKVLV